MLKPKKKRSSKTPVAVTIEEYKKEVNKRG